MRDPGKPFGNYMLLERLARGGMAEVFLARQQGPQAFDRLVAVKRILPHLMDSDDVVRMFQDEARLAARLSHPNVVHIYEFGNVDEHHFIAMEFVDGVHAGALIEHGVVEPMPPALVARIAADACAGLNHAHRLTDAQGQPLHLVHRDISPPNLMISYDGVVKLVDFGIAKAVDMAGKTMPGIVKGKFAYMSPEQTMGKKLDGRSDVFSLGMVIWEMLAGRVALDRTDPVEVMRCIRDGRLPDIRQARPDVPPGLAEILSMALENKPARRPSAAELGSAFEGFIKSWPELATSMQVSEWVTSRFARRATSGADQAQPLYTPEPEFAPPPPAPRSTQPPSLSFLHDDDDDDDATQQMSSAAEIALLLPRAHPGGGERIPLPAPPHTPVPGPHLTMPPHTPVPAPFAASHPGRLDSAAPERGPSRRSRIIAGAVLVAVVLGIVLVVAGSGGDSGSSSEAGARALSDAGAGDPAPGDASLDRTSAAAGDAGVPGDAGPAGQTAWLIIETGPEGAAVTLDDREPTASPAFFDDLAPGAHELAISLSGYQDIEETLELAPGENRHTYTLQRSKKQRRGKGKLAVFTRPSCTAYLGKQKLGNTPFAGKKLDEGSYTLTCEQSGYKTATERVRIQSGKTTKVNLTLQKK